ncbi:MAG: hypothetical protein ACD_46C00598G0001 [uncultured bacterium]|nr:MAG: hypothetical protein ACD_46C00598G0001 [uncultured bacterium]
MPMSRPTKVSSKKGLINSLKKIGSPSEQLLSDIASIEKVPDEKFESPIQLSIIIFTVIYRNQEIMSSKGNEAFKAFCNNVKLDKSPVLNISYK